VADDLFLVLELFRPVLVWPSLGAPSTLEFSFLSDPPGFRVYSGPRSLVTLALSSAMLFDGRG